MVLRIGVVTAVAASCPNSSSAPSRTAPVHLAPGFLCTSHARVCRPPTSRAAASRRLGHLVRPGDLEQRAKYLGLMLPPVFGGMREAQTPIALLQRLRHDLTSPGWRLVTTPAARTMRSASARSACRPETVSR